jgi:hypothetical protein
MVWKIEGWPTRAWLWIMGHRVQVAVFSVGALVFAAICVLTIPAVRETTGLQRPASDDAEVVAEADPLAAAMRDRLFGRIASDIPDHMKQGKREKITVRISANTTDDLTKDLVEHPVVQDQIAVYPNMSVDLESDGTFLIPPNFS